MGKGIRKEASKQAKFYLTSKLDKRDRMGTMASQ